MKTPTNLTITLICLVTLAPIQTLGQSWTKGLEHGGVVKIDPSTNRATIYNDQGSTQLWDGTHRLENGSVIIVEDGVVKSGGEEVQHNIAPVTTDPGGPVAGSSTCVELVIKVCGFNGECRDAKACSPARQLMQLEKEEAWQTHSQGPNETSAECRKALSNEGYFARCDNQQLSDAPTSCEKLVSRVCGEDAVCSESPGCPPARQLLAMETQERLASRAPDRQTYTSRKCEEALKGSDFFRQCGHQAEDPDSEAGDSDSETPVSETSPAPPRFRDLTRR